MVGWRMNALAERLEGERAKPSGGTGARRHRISPGRLVRGLVLAGAAAATLASGAAIADEPVPVEGLLPGPSFETTRVGRIPRGWIVPPIHARRGMQLRVVDAPVLAGDRALMLDGTGITRGTRGEIFTVAQIEGLRGRRVQVRAGLAGWRAADVPEADALAGFWLRVDDVNGVPVADGEVAIPTLPPADADAIAAAEPSDWRPVDLSFDVPATSASITFGLTVFGAVAVLDDVRILDLGPIAGADPLEPQPLAPPVGFARLVGQPASALTDRGERNLTALARAFGIARNFNPADGTADVDWDTLLLNAIPFAEAAADDEELIERLRSILDPRAPGMTFWSGRAVDGPGQVVTPDPRPRISVLREHQGFAAPGGGSPIYSSRTRRFNRDEPEPPVPGRMPLDTWIPVGHAVDTEIVPGLHMRCVVHLPMLAGATVPAAETLDPASGIVPAERRGMRPDDRTIRLAGVIRLWNVMQHFFPYFRDIDTDWEMELRPALQVASSVDSARAWATDLQRMTTRLRDGHVNVSHATLFSGWMLQSNWQWTPAGVVCVAVHDADVDAGIRRGDELLSIDGQSIDAWCTRQFGLVSGSPQWVRARSQAMLLTLASGDRAVLEVRQPGEEKRSVTVPCTPPAADLTPEVERPEPISELQPGVMYVNLDVVEEEQLRDALPQLVAADGIVVDMRGYPGIGPWILGHLSDTLLNSATWSVPLYRLPDRQQVEYATSRWAMPPAAPRIPGRTVWLQGGGSISYAESIMGIVEAYGLGTIVGEPTAGANGNVTNVLLPGLAYVSWTGMRVVKHDGSRHHVDGIPVDVPVMPTLAGIRDGRDEVLEAGLAVLLEELAADGIVPGEAADEAAGDAADDAADGEADEEPAAEEDADGSADDADASVKRGAGGG